MPLVFIHNRISRAQLLCVVRCWVVIASAWPTMSLGCLRPKDHLPITKQQERRQHKRIRGTRFLLRGLQITDRRVLSNPRRWQPPMLRRCLALLALSLTFLHFHKQKQANWATNRINKFFEPLILGVPVSVQAVHRLIRPGDTFNPGETKIFTVLAQVSNRLIFQWPFVGV